MKSPFKNRQLLKTMNMKYKYFVSLKERIVYEGAELLNTASYYFD